MNYSIPPALLPFVGFLAVLGGIALVVRLGRSLVRLGLTAAELGAASGLAEVSARRGDITGLAERASHGATLRHNRRRDIAVVLFWLALLVIPPLAGWTRVVYAASAVLWLLPRRPILQRAIRVPVERP
ncbi:MAG TPA: hypothetical protein VE913_11280 [Longimicrobium sp.]|nr:hypothetical protein [Longimicrobium sp.]